MATTTWVFDPSHSELNFDVRHMMIARVKGTFTRFSVEVNGEDLFRSNVHVHVETSSVNTNNADRDNHLRSGDFFDSENFPHMEFRSTSWKPAGEGQYTLTGMLKIKDVEKEVSLNVEFGGINKDPWGNEKAGFSIEGKINRKEWGLNWNAALETGGVLVSEEVKITADVQLAKQTV